MLNVKLKTECPIQNPYGYFFSPAHSSIIGKLRLDWSVKFGIGHIRNRGIAGDVTDGGVMKRLEEIIYFKPKAVFILIGINDLFNLHHEEDNPALKYDKVVRSPGYIGKNILKIARTIHRKSPVMKIYVRTLLPTRREYLKGDILGKQINQKK